MKSLFDIISNKLPIPKKYKDYSYKSFSEITQDIDRLDSLVNNYDDKKYFFRSLFKSIFDETWTDDHIDLYDYNEFLGVTQDHNFDNLEKIYIKYGFKKLYDDIILNLLIYTCNLIYDEYREFECDYTPLFKHINKETIEKYIDVISKNKYSKDSLLIVMKCDSHIKEFKKYLLKLLKSKLKQF